MLGIIVVLLVLILWRVNDIGKRLKEMFPTEKEQDYKMSQDDPMGHWEKHKNNKQSKLDKE